MDSFTARLNAAEGSYFRSEQDNAVKMHMEKLMEQGRLPQTQSALTSFGEGVSQPAANFMGEALPITVINSRPASEVGHEELMISVCLKQMLATVF